MPGSIPLCFFVILLAVPLKSYSQISPGPLSRWHSNLEGITHCTSCHTLGKLISNGKCLNCHKEIETRIAANTGYHSTVKTKPCAECHQEHLGGDYEIVRFDTTTFDHSVVGFILDGNHKTIGCRSCHNPRYVVQADVRRLGADQFANTYLGLSPNCSSCHEDAHKGQFSQPCSSCHTTVAWKPAGKFNHDMTEYPLTGRHRSVECYDCHKEKMKDGKTVLYTNLPFASCSSCHADPHKGAFKEPCATCHSTESFAKIAPGTFDHSKTQYPLLGRHADLKCQQCHQSDPRKLNVGGTYGFRITRFQQCSDCHSDAHGGQFDGIAGGDRCENCHNVYGFIPTTFSIAAHQKTAFVLEGAHLAVACSDCHLANKVHAASTRQFVWAAEVTCLTCHADVHKGQFAGSMQKGCTTCHTSVAWDSLNFSHDKTKFPLRGRHASIACAACHKQPADPALPVQYVGLDTRCYSCHADVHAGQFSFDSVTHCGNCHTSESWQRLIFDHDTQSDFPLTGKHKDVPCAKCHPAVKINGNSIVKYRPLGTRCVDCHSA